ncbi:hypothetical protein LMH73_023840 [Vibrio splendidus]|nr:hypothetical protein [Vibrio splendidus]MCC4883081.1 hypothetical protein [Vibrio splendidus]
MKKLLLIAGLLTLSGCSVIDNEQRDDYSLQSKAALALGTSADKIQVKNRTADIMKVEFDAVYNKRTFSCYYTGGVVLTSDTICSATDGKKMPKATQCNALLEAAGKCS